MANDPENTASTERNVLYISSRINAPDGSSVHGRAFVRNVKKLGHDIRTFPEIAPIQYIQDSSGTIDTRSKWQRLIDAGLGTVIKGRVRQLGRIASDVVDVIEGVQETIQYFNGARKILKSFKPDVLIYRSTLYNFAPQIIRKLYGLPCVAEVNSIKYLEISVASRTGVSARLVKWAEQFAINHSDRVFVVSAPIKDFVDTFYPANHCSVIANGVETVDFDPGLFDRDALKAKVGLAGKTVLGYVGSYKEWHGITTSLDLIEKLNAKDPSYALLLVGNGEQYSVIKSLIASRQLEGMVKQIDYVAHDQVPECTAIFDYAVMTYPDFDGFYFSPLKMYEYMSMGTPVVSTNTGQIGSILKHEKTGILVYPPSVDNFQQAIEALQGNPAQYKAIATDSRHEVLESHSWLGNARSVMDVCEELIGSNNSNALQENNVKA